MKPQRIFLSLIPVITALCAHAQQISVSGAYDFLNISTSTRAYGLGGINISDISSDINSSDQNPALLGPESGMQAGLDYMRYIASTNLAGARFCKPAGERSAWSAGMKYIGYGTIEGTDQNGNPTGDFSPKDIMFTASYSRDITEFWRGGASLKTIYSSYGSYSAVAIVTDLGVNYYDPDRDLSISFVAANLGGQVKRFDEAYSRPPFDLRAGWTQSFGSLPVRFSVTAWNLTKWHLPYINEGDGSTTSESVVKDSFGSNLLRHLIFAANFIPSEKISVGIGYNYKTRTDMDSYSRTVLSGLSLSASLRVSSFAVGLAFAQPHKSASTFMVNLSTRLSDLL